MPDMHSNLGPEPEDEQRLFKAFAATCPESADRVDLLDLAAWLDGRLGEDQATSLEARLARDPHGRELLAAIRLGPALNPETVSTTCLEQLRGLPAHTESSLNFEAHAGRPTSRAWWASTAAAASIAVAILGFLTGRLAATEADTSESRFLAVATFNVFESDDMNATAFDEVLIDGTAMEVER